MVPHPMSECMGSPQTNSSELSQGQRPMGRKCAKEQLKNKGGDEGSYKNAIQEGFEVARG